MAGQRAALRLLLVVLVALGVAGMHTLGHPRGGGHGSGAPAGTAHMTEPAPAAMDVAGEVVVHGWDLGLDPSSVCLAILVVFSVAALLTALLLRGGRRPPPTGRHRRLIAPAGRGPPPPVSVGSRLADLSVLRI
jgi:hypothetical protein